MIGVIFLIGATLLGIGLVRRCLGPVLSAAEQVFWGVPIGWAGTTTIAYLAARMAGALSFRTALLVALFVWATAVVSWLPELRRLVRREERSVRVAWQKSWTPLVVLLVVFAPIVLHLFGTHMLPMRDGNIYSGGESTSYDMAFHAAITNAFVHGANFPPVYTPMPPAPLHYPFLPDFLSALMVVLGMDLHPALVGTAFPLCLALLGVFYFFALRLLKLAELEFFESRDTWTAAIATLLFLLNGGLGFLLFIQDWRTAGTGLWQFLSTLNINYTHIGEKGLVWPNVITDMLLPQRTSIFGLSLGFIVLSCFAISWAKAKDGRWSGWEVLLGAGVVTALLPWFHVHSYGAVGLISGFLFLLRPRRVWLVFWFPAVILALPHFLDLGSQVAATGFMRFQPGWRGQGEKSWLLFWFRNVGLPALLIIAAALTAPRPLRLFYLSFIALLALALLVIFSPNDYDNLKLMTYWHAGTCVVIAGWLMYLAKTRIGLGLSIVLVLVSVSSGLLALIYEWRASKLLFGRDEVAAAEFVKAETSPHSLVLTAPSLHQPILSLAGRAVVRGPTAWLWSHGYPFAEREADVRAIYAGRDDALDLLRYYRIDYVYLGKNEFAELRANRSFFDDALPAVYRMGDIAIYDARKLRVNNPAAASSGYPPREYAARVDRDPSQMFAEFPAIAFELYRLRKVAFGSPPAYADFLSDLRKLGREVHVGASGWREILEKNKRALCDEWIGRGPFQERYEGMNDTQYVAALFENAQLSSTEHERAALTAELAGARENRASILRRIGDDRRLYRRDYKAAYVLCHYFAYLRRNPEDLPDHDLAGYKFWLTQLERSSDYRGLTRAFIEADEYKQQVR